MESIADTPTAPQNEIQVLRDENNFIQNVSQFFNQQDLSDIILKVGEHQFYGHKFVLAKSSDVFRTMLYDHRWSQAGMPEIELSESKECQAVFEKFLRFLYTAEIDISVGTAVGILCLADKYNVRSLKGLCMQYMVENAKSPQVENALHWYSWAKALHLEELIDQCSKTIAWNTSCLLESPEWLNMDIDFIFDMLQTSDLVVTCEYDLYKAILKWLEHEAHVSSLEENAKKLLPLVRYPQMKVSDLFEIEQSRWAQESVCKNILHELIGKAYRFRSLCPAQNYLDVAFSQPFYLPRNYTELLVDSVRMQNTLRFGIQVDVRTYVGAVPQDVKEGEWKITYRKTNDCWMLQIYCHDSALMNGEARVQAALLVYNDEEKVIHVEESHTHVCTRGNHLSMSVSLPNQDATKAMNVLIKPMPK